MVEEELEQIQEEVIIVEDEPKEDPPAPETVSMEAIEEAAKAAGWSPDGAKGRGENKTAWEYLQDPSPYIARKNEALEEQVEALRGESQSAYDALAKHITRQEQNEYVKEHRTLQEQINEAEVEGDASKVRALMEQRGQIPPPVQVEDPNTAAFAQFESDPDNAWIVGNPGMFEDFKARYAGEVALNGRVNNARQVLPKAMEKMKAAHPTEVPGYKPPTPKNPNAQRGAGVEKGGKPASAKQSGLKKSDLTDTEKALFSSLIETGGLSEAQLLKAVERQRATNSE